MKGFWAIIAPFAPVACLILAYMWPVVGGFSHRVVAPYGGLDAVAQSGILEWTGRHFWQLDVWPHLPIFYPETTALAFMDTLLGQAWLVWPLRLFSSGTPALWYNLAYLGSLVLGAGCFALLWRVSGGAWWSAGCGAVALLGSPFTLSQLGHLNQLPAPPLLLALAALLLALRRTFDRRTGSVPAWWWWGGAVALQAAWGWYGLAYAAFASALLMIWSTWRCYQSRGLKRYARQTIGPSLVILVAVLALAQPYLHTSSRYDDYERSDAEIMYYSADIKDFLNSGAYRAGWSDLVGKGTSGPERYADASRTVLHPGWLALALALVGWCGRRNLSHAQRVDGSSLLVVGALGLILAFGDSVGIPGSNHRFPLPLGILQAILEPLRAFRTVWRFSFLTVLAVAWWAAAGWEVLRRWPGHERWGTACAAVLMALLLVESLPVALPGLPLPGAVTSPGGEPLAVLPAGAVLTLPAPPDEYGEDLVEAYWLHRSLSHGHPVTGGASGWVPPYTRRLRERLALCVEGRGDLVSLWNELHTLGVRYVEVQDANDAQREQTWRRLLLEHGFRPTPSAPGYTLYLLPGETARSTDGS